MTVCKNCGVVSEDDVKFCSNCGNSLSDQIQHDYNTVDENYDEPEFVPPSNDYSQNNYIPPVNNASYQAPNYQQPNYNYQAPNGNYQTPNQDPYYSQQLANQKDRLLVILLALILGNFGIHNFYLGFNDKGIKQLLLSVLLSWTFIVPLIVWICAIIEAVKATHDANGVPLC